MDDCVELGCAVLYLFLLLFFKDVKQNSLFFWFLFFLSHYSSYFITACKARVFSYELLCVAKTALEILKKDFLVHWYIWYCQNKYDRELQNYVCVLLVFQNCVWSFMYTVFVLFSCSTGMHAYVHPHTPLP